MTIPFLQQILRFLFFCFFLSFPISVYSETNPLAKKGLLDLSNWDFEKKGNIQLYGEWEFFWNELIHPSDTVAIKEKKEFIHFPSLWNEKKIEDNFLEGQGFATYKLTLILPSHYPILGIRIGDMYSSYSLWINDELIATNGVVGKDKTSTKAQWLPITKVFKNHGGINTITLQVANFHHRKGGTWSDLMIGTPNDIFKARINSVMFEIFLFGSLLIMAVYHFGLYILRRKEKSTIYFGLFCIAAIFRILLTGERYLVDVFPEIPFEGQLKMEYLSFYFSFPFFIYFLYLAFPGQINKRLLIFSFSVTAFFAFIVFITEGLIYSYTAIPFQGIVFIFLLYTISKLIVAIKKDIKGGLAALIGIICLVLTFIIDILYNNEIINFGNISPLGVFIFIFSQSFLLSQKFSIAFREVETLSKDLFNTNKIYSYFVPTEFLQLLNVEKITDIRLGAQSERKMTILFSDIRGFTKLSEGMSPKENFEFINSYLKQVTPYIVMNRGFIDKYIGDGIMAIFPESSFDAIDASIEMLEALENLNELRKMENKEPIQIGIGIHSGSTIIGTIGAMERMEGTVISDVVNLASRLEGLTKVFGSKIIISEHLYNSLPMNKQYHNRYLGQVEVKGKTGTTKIREILIGDSESIQKKIEFKLEFEEAVNLFFLENYSEAKNKFEYLKGKIPKDLALEFYEKKILDYQKFGKMYNPEN